MDKNEQYIAGLEHIQTCRRVNLRNSKVITILFFIGLLVSVIFPPAIFLEFLAFGLMCYSHYKTAHVPCPRCEKPFGSAWILPLAVGTNECSNCKLSLNLLYEHKKSLKSHTKEWLE